MIFFADYDAKEANRFNHLFGFGAGVALIFSGCMVKYFSSFFVSFEIFMVLDQFSWIRSSESATDYHLGKLTLNGLYLPLFSYILLHLLLIS